MKYSIIYASVEEISEEDREELISDINSMFCDVHVTFLDPDGPGRYYLSIRSNKLEHESLERYLYDNDFIPFLIGRFFKGSKMETRKDVDLFINNVNYNKDHNEFRNRTKIAMSAIGEPTNPLLYVECKLDSLDKTERFLKLHGYTEIE